MHGKTDAHSGRWRLRIAAATLAAAALTAAWYLLAPTPAAAEPSVMSGFAAAYPAAAGTPLDSCLLCHTNPAAPTEDNLNRYGKDWEESSIGDERFLSPALVNRDSDGDGIPNGQEIEQLSFPGNASSSTPPITTTTVPGTPPSGQALYGARCAACHGPDGGDLNGTTLGRNRFINITLGGQGTMPAQTGLTNDEVGAIWDFVTGRTAPTTTTTTNPTGPTTTTAPAGGAAAYAQSCAICHGPSGGDLVPTTLSRSRLIDIITSGTGSMRGFPELGAPTIRAVADYLLAIGANPPTTTTTPGATTTTAPARSGSAVYAAECSACHGAGGGNLRGRTMTLSRITAVTNDGTAGMPGYRTRLSSTEISRVSAYVLSVAAPAASTSTTNPTAAATLPAGSTLYQQNCSACHGLHGEGGSGGPVRGTAMARSSILEVITSGTSGMPAYAATLTGADIEAVADHVLGMSAAALSTTSTTSAATAEESQPPTTVPAEQGPAGPTLEAADQEPGPIAIVSDDSTTGLTTGNVLRVVILSLAMITAVVVALRSLYNLTGFSED